MSLETDQLREHIQRLVALVATWAPLHEDNARWHGTDALAAIEGIEERETWWLRMVNDRDELLDDIFAAATLEDVRELIGAARDFTDGERY